jgi:hypothetical protein
MPFNHISSRTIFILSSHLHLGLQSSLCSQFFLTNPLNVFPFLFNECYMLH